MSHYVYRLYAASGRLLYVGFTRDVGRRLKEHKSKAWWSQVVEIRSRTYRTERLARAAETRAIRDEHPTYNLMQPGPRAAFLCVGCGRPISALRDHYLTDVGTFGPCCTARPSTHARQWPTCHEPGHEVVDHCSHVATRSGLAAQLRAERRYADREAR